jgi:cytidylate kinase
MKIQLSGNLIRHYLQNVYFINGHSCAGKSTMVKLLAQRYGMICCGENYHDVFPREKLSRWAQPGLCYFDTMSGWEEWLSMTPEEHWNWTEQVSRECAEIEILELVKLSAEGKKIIVDTNIPADILREISDYRHVAIMLCDPPDACATRFFDREDPEKQFMLEQIKRCRDPEATMKNFTAWTLYHPPEETDWQHTGFFTYTRSDFESDTREETLRILAEHFGFL